MRPDFPRGEYASTGMYCRYILTCDRVYCFYCNPEWRILLEGCCILVGECNVLVGAGIYYHWAGAAWLGACRKGFPFHQHKAEVDARNVFILFVCVLFFCKQLVW